MKNKSIYFAFLSFFLATPAIANWDWPEENMLRWQLDDLPGAWAECILDHLEGMCSDMLGHEAEFPRPDLECPDECPTRQFLNIIFPVRLTWDFRSEIYPAHEYQHEECDIVASTCNCATGFSKIIHARWVNSRAVVNWECGKACGGNDCEDDEDCPPTSVTIPPSLARSAPNTPIEVVALVDKSLQWNRNKRFANAAEMRDACNAVIARLKGGPPLSASNAPPKT